MLKPDFDPLTSKTTSSSLSLLETHVNCKVYSTAELSDDAKPVPYPYSGEDDAKPVPYRVKWRWWCHTGSLPVQWRSGMFSPWLGAGLPLSRPLLGRWYGWGCWGPGRGQPPRLHSYPSQLNHAKQYIIYEQKTKQWTINILSFLHNMKQLAMPGDHVVLRIVLF